jgi:alkylhydroperoxidase/carboxymuconolactone decarboxylase family protein YurZ
MKMSEFATNGLLESTGASAHLTDREKHLIGIAVTATRGCVACTGGRLKKASDVGVPYAVLVAAVDLAASVNAGVTVAIALQGADLNGIACKDGVCTAGLPTC